MSTPPERDMWLFTAVGAIAVLYVWLVLLRPGGEGWGRGWNMIAFLFYAAPIAVLAAATAAWRRSKTQGLLGKVALWAAVAGFAFPVVCVLAIRLKA